MEKDGRKVPLYLERNSLRLEAHVLERASRLGYVAAGTAVTDELMDGVDIKESHAVVECWPSCGTISLSRNDICICIGNVVEHQRFAFQIT